MNKRNLKKLDTLTRINTINTINQYPIRIPQSDIVTSNVPELSNIIKKLESESLSSPSGPFPSLSLLERIIKLSPSSADEVSKKLALSFDSCEHLSSILVSKVVQTLSGLLRDASQTLTFVSALLPVLTRISTRTKASLADVESLNATAGKLVALGGTTTRTIVESNVEALLERIRNEDRASIKLPNAKFAVIDLLGTLLEKSEGLVIAKVIEKENLEVIMKIVDGFKDPKIEIRYAVGELIQKFIGMFNNRDISVKINYENAVYNRIMGNFLLHLKENNSVPTDSNIINGLFYSLTKIYIADPSFFKNNQIFEILCKNLLECIKSKNNNIKIEFIKFVPNLRRMNKEIFSEKVCGPFMQFMISILNVKTNTDLRNTSLLSLGSLSLVLKLSEFKPVLVSLLTLIKILLENNEVYDKEIFKCLNDLLVNRDNLYVDSFVANFKIVAIISKFFKQRLTGFNVDFLISALNAYPKNSKEHVAIVIIALNAVSIMISGENFEFKYFYKQIAGEEGNYIHPELDKILATSNKFVQKYIEKLNDNISEANKIKRKNIPTYCQCKCLFDVQLILNSLRFISLLRSPLFEKDLLYFYVSKLLPLITISDARISKKIVSLSLSPFVSIQKEDSNFSLFCLSRILGAFEETAASSSEDSVKAEVFSSLANSKSLQDALISGGEEAGPRLVGVLRSGVGDEVKERLVEWMGVMSRRSGRKNFYASLFKVTIERSMFFIDNSKDIILIENELNGVYKYCIHVKHLFQIELIELIIEHLINICIRFPELDIKYNCINILCEIVQCEALKSNFEQKASEHLRRFLKFFLIICINTLKEGELNPSRTNISLRGLENLIILHKIDIYQIHKINLLKSEEAFISLLFKESSSYFFEIDDEEKHEIKINFLDIFFRIIKNGTSDENVQTILSIMSSCGIREPQLIKSDLMYNNLLSGFNNLRKNNSNNAVFYNKNKEEIDLSKSDPSICQAIIELMFILKENIQHELKGQIINFLPAIVKSLNENDENLIDILMPTIIYIIPFVDYQYKTKLMETVMIIFQNFKVKFISYMDDILELIIKSLNNENYVSLILNIMKRLFDEFPFDLEKFYSVLIPTLIELLQKNSKETISIIECLTLMAKYPNCFISLYLDNILAELKNIFTISDDIKVLNIIFDFITNIISTQNTKMLYLSLVPIFLDKIKKIKSTELSNSDNITLVKRTLKLFNQINSKDRDSFIVFLPSLISSLNQSNIFRSMDLRSFIYPLLNERGQKGFMTRDSLLNSLCESPCSVNCSMGFNPLISELTKAKMKSLNAKRASNLLANFNDGRIRNMRGTVAGARMKGDTEAIVKKFDCSGINSVEEWNEWFKSTSKILFNQSSSYPLYFCHMVSDYYYPLILELYDYGFFSVYNNLSEEQKEKINRYLKYALDNQNTPTDIILTILNLSDFLEKNNQQLYFTDLQQFAKLSIKCRALSKAVFYIESDFNIKNYFENVEELIDLYYNLNYPDSVVGVMELIKKLEKDKLNCIDQEPCLKPEDNKEKINKIANDYSYMIKLHDYAGAISLIKKQMDNNKDDEEKMKTLKNDYSDCLYGLSDWEELLNEDKESRSPQNIYQNLNLLTEPEEIKDAFLRELRLTKASFNLGEWHQLRMHFNNIRQIVIQNSNLIDEENELCRKDDENSRKESANEIQEELTETQDLPSDEKLFAFSHNLLSQDSYALPSFLKRRESASPNRKGTISMKGINRSKTISSPEVHYAKFIDFKRIAEMDEKFSFLLENDETLYKLNVYGAVNFIFNYKFEIAKEYIESIKKSTLLKIKSIVDDSYSRSYRILALNQLVSLLENIIEYKTERQDKYGETKLKSKLMEKWSHFLDMKTSDENFYEIFLAVKTLIEPFENNVDYYINLAKICRKNGKFIQSEKILNRLIRKLKLDNDNDENKNVLNPISLKVSLELNKNLFSMGLVREAISHSRSLIDSLELAPNKKTLDSSLKSRVYGSFAVYKMRDFFLRTGAGEFRRKGGSTHRNMKSRVMKSKTLPFKIVNRLAEENDEEEIVKKVNYYLLMATKFDNSNYKFWHSYGVFNYKYYKLLVEEENEENAEDDLNDNNNKDMNEKDNKDSNNNNSNMGNNGSIMSKFRKTEGTFDNSNKNYIFAENAIQGFKNSLTLGGNNVNKTFQDLLRLLDLFFSCAEKNVRILKLIQESFEAVNVDCYLSILPQLFSRLNIDNIQILEILIKLLIRIGSVHLKDILYPLLVIKNSNSKKRRAAAIQVLNGISGSSPSISRSISLTERFIFEVNRVAILLHEQWSEEIEDCAKLFLTRNYSEMIARLLKLHEETRRKPETLYEKHFFQRFGGILRVAENKLRRFLEKSEEEEIKEAWELYHSVYRSISSSFPFFKKMSLDYVSPYLRQYLGDSLALPGAAQGSKLRIKSFRNDVMVFDSKQHPRRLALIASDEKEYRFLLKGHEDLRQDQRAMQLFGLVNTLLNNDTTTCNKNISITTYAVLPLSNNTGLIGWVNNCDTINQLIRDQRAAVGTTSNIEYQKLRKMCPRYESLSMLHKVEVFKEAMSETQGTDLRQSLWIKSKSSDSWLERRSCFSRSLAVMSIVGYILGLGDRHPNNLMVGRSTGKVIHIDFGDCFEIAMKREKFPERVPFRLTRMLIRAMEISGIEGTFRIVCDNTMRILRENKDSLMTIISSSLHDPLISFRLMVPLIIQTKKKNAIMKQAGYTVTKSAKISRLPSNAQDMKSPIKKKKQHLEDEPRISVLLKQNLKPFESPIKQKKKKESENGSSQPKFSKSPAKIAHHIPNAQNMVRNEINENIPIVDGDIENYEKQKLQNEEKQIFNLFEERDEIESEELNEIAQIVINRITDKLSGKDFGPCSIYSVKEQVDKLINEATSAENLSQSYLGWCPYW